MHTDPTLWSATEQARAIRERRLGSEELLELCLERSALLTRIAPESERRPPTRPPCAASAGGRCTDCRSR
jgi:hypothetical protein